MKTVTLMTDGTVANIHWADNHTAFIRLLCGCWWCEKCGSLRALPDCKGHKRDVERYGPGGAWTLGVDTGGCAGPGAPGSPAGPAGEAGLAGPAAG